MVDNWDHDPQQPPTTCGLDKFWLISSHPMAQNHALRDQAVPMARAKRLLSRWRTQLPESPALLAHTVLCIKVIRVGLQARLEQGHDPSSGNW